MATAAVVTEQMSARIEGPFVVFMIGARINKPWRVRDWWRVTRAMGPMLRELRRRPELGLLAQRLWLGTRGPMIVQYWRSVEQLERFAGDTSLPHRQAWLDFYRYVNTSAGGVGIWHESYQVQPGGYEAAYVGMPRFGLAEAGEHLPVREVGERAATRRAGGQRGARLVPTKGEQ
jgi:hypothetical protein